MATECIKTFQLTTIQTIDDCRLLQQEIYQIILGYDDTFQAKRFAPFATTSEANWLNIVNNVQNQIVLLLLNILT
jgi:hypothetical protein